MLPLAKEFRVIVVDLRGMGSSEKPAGGYDKKTMARDVFELISQLGFYQVNIAGNDIGSMVAFSFAANHPESTRKSLATDFKLVKVENSGHYIVEEQPEPDQRIGGRIPAHRFAEFHRRGPARDRGARWFIGVDSRLLDEAGPDFARRKRPDDALEFVKATMQSHGLMVHSRVAVLADGADGSIERMVPNVAEASARRMANPPLYLANSRFIAPPPSA